MRITKHASRRLQQRGITISQVEFILLYGAKDRRPGDAYRLRITRKTIKSKNLYKEVCSRQILDNISNIGLILDKNIDTVITGYHIKS
jgi:hypothetical protein